MIAGYGWDEFKIERLTIYQHKAGLNGPKAAKIKDAGRGRKQYTISVYGNVWMLKKNKIWSLASTQAFKHSDGSPMDQLSRPKAQGWSFFSMFGRSANERTTKQYKLAAGRSMEEY